MDGKGSISKEYNKEKRPLKQEAFDKNYIENQLFS